MRERVGGMRDEHRGVERRGLITRDEGEETSDVWW